MITTPEIFCDLISFLDKDQIERIQLVNHFWNNVIIRHKNILPLRQFRLLDFDQNRINLYVTEEDRYYGLVGYKSEFDGTSLIEENVSSRYSQLTVDEVLNNLNDGVFDTIQIQYYQTTETHPDYGRLDNFLKIIKLFKTKTGGRFRGRIGECCLDRYDSKLAEIFDNYIIVDQLDIFLCDKHIREAFVNPEIVQLPSTPKEISLARLLFEENEEVLNFTCNGKLNGANRLTIQLYVSDKNDGNFIRQWFELYSTHQNPISLVGKFGIQIIYDVNSILILDAVKTFLNNTQLRVKYSLETKESYHPNISNLCKVLRRCVLHETDSYALVIEMKYVGVEVGIMSSISASDWDQPNRNRMSWLSLCVKSL